MIRTALVFALALLAIAVSWPVRAAVYAYADDNGVTHYSNVPADSRYQLLLDDTSVTAVSPDLAPTLSAQLKRSERYSRLIERAAQASRIEPALVRAVMVAESGSDPLAVSRRGASGLMQLMPATARQYGVQNIFDPEQNIRAGSQYLRDLTDRYRNDLKLVLAAYNAGPASVDPLGSVPSFKETLEYIPRVLRIYEHLTRPTHE